ncbi:hypothetical protein AURDEDRAFT_177404 [Auricularia subglabra TFB-10046 SS5]|uniref:Uncharacterized protein n=1 Tax=Auricularia subglabra (strain TFB-10046 / SS5) TaxID=717982 RepID=J0LAR7_AURST|nr:hypothetical protein AURDEDRAFT_177404 [Auricularia subglabra TFB-10046 SS5]
MGLPAPSSRAAVGLPACDTGSNIYAGVSADASQDMLTTPPRLTDAGTNPLPRSCNDKRSPPLSKWAILPPIKNIQNPDLDSPLEPLVNIVGARATHFASAGATNRERPPPRSPMTTPRGRAPGYAPNGASRRLAMRAREAQNTGHTNARRGSSARTSTDPHNSTDRQPHRSRTAGRPTPMLPMPAMEPEHFTVLRTGRSRQSVTTLCKICLLALHDVQQAEAHDHKHDNHRLFICHGRCGKSFGDDAARWTHWMADAVCKRGHDLAIMSATISAVNQA